MRAKPWKCRRGKSRMLIAFYKEKADGRWQKAEGRKKKKYTIFTSHTSHTLPLPFFGVPSS
jgi:hypothetical protein